MEKIMGNITLPDWAQNMREIFRAGTASQFIISGNINDFVLHNPGDQFKFYSLKTYLNEVLFAPFEVVLFYDRGQGIQLAKGSEAFFKYLQLFDKFHGTRFASDAGVQGSDPARILDAPNLLPRVPGQALELIDRFIRSMAVKSGNTKSAEPDTKAKPGESVAVVLDYANFLVPRGESLYLSGDIGANLIKILGWSKEPLITGSNIVTVLLTENMNDLHESVLNNPYSAKIQINLPEKCEMETFIQFLAKQEPDFARFCELEIPLLSEKLVGLSRINAKNLLLRSIRNRQSVTLKYVSQIKKELIEKEAGDKLEFVESKRTLADVAGHEAAKQWFREDAKLLREGASHALPMGYLITGRIGIGKTYLVECFAGECGVPFVALKNFRDKWVGATESNLEKIFAILKALGQVVVFVDEADQLAGHRNSGDSDSGLSGRIYGMLAKEMANTEHRGKILWIFATSRPDLLEVDLKRQGRLDVHIPLFPTTDPSEIKALLLAMAKKTGADLNPDNLPELNFTDPISGNELEGLLVRALRVYELQKGTAQSTNFNGILQKICLEFRPSSHRARLEFMDLLAVKECTDERFLPDRFREMDMLQIEKRIAELQ
jgi:AAA+ superfamily predicted ATPase